MHILWSSTDNSDMIVIVLKTRCVLTGYSLLQAHNTVTDLHDKKLPSSLQTLLSRKVSQTSVQQQPESQ
jgi:hypothetical protein